jgi:hypothetical protein
MSPEMCFCRKGRCFVSSFICCCSNTARVKSTTRVGEAVAEWGTMRRGNLAVFVTEGERFFVGRSQENS